MPDIDRKTRAILRLVSEANEPIGSTLIASKLKAEGIDLSERTVRYYLKNMNDQGLIKVFWKEGRMITKKGDDELNDAFVSDKVGLISSRMESMAYQMTFDLTSLTGKVILNFSFFHKSEFKKALKIMRAVFSKKLSMGDRVAVIGAGQKIGGLAVPTGKVGFGTLCSININGILLKHSIPVESKFGGVLQIENGKPHRFTELISYAGSTLDPHEIFIRSRMTSVREAAGGSGKILAGLREIPAVSKDDAEKIIKQAAAAGFGETIIIGRPSQPLLGMPVSPNKVGIVLAGGLNPVAAAEEWGLETESKALVTMIEYEELKSFWDI